MTIWLLTTVPVIKLDVDERSRQLKRISFPWRIGLFIMPDQLVLLSPSETNFPVREKERHFQLGMKAVLFQLTVTVTEKAK